MRAPIWKLKTPIISKPGKRLLWLATTWRIVEKLQRELCIRGHHIYKEIWDPVIGELVQCEREPRNEADIYSVAITKGGVFVGHSPWRIFRLCLLFLRCGRYDWKFFVFSIFGFLEVSENILAPKISGFTIFTSIILVCWQTRLQGMPIFGKIERSNIVDMANLTP